LIFLKKVSVILIFLKKVSVILIFFEKVSVILIFLEKVSVFLTVYFSHCSVLLLTTLSLLYAKLSKVTIIKRKLAVKYD
jgi:hypothetical protein